MTDASTVHAALVVAVDTVSGMAKSPVAFREDLIPDGLSNGYFYVEPVAEDNGAIDGTTQSTDRLGFRVVFAWRLTQDPNAGVSAAIAKAKAIRTALAADPIGDARIQVTDTAYDYADHHVIVSLEGVAMYTTTNA